ncbi:catalase [Kaistella daneshvariae]
MISAKIRYFLRNIREWLLLRFPKKIMNSLQKFSPEFNELSAAENISLEKAIRSAEKFVENSPKISGVNYATRDAHSKTYATVKAKLEISENLPDFIAKIFDKESYELLLRFSNANLVINKKGREIPAYGFSLKIKNIGQNEANFPLVNFPLFPTNSPSVFLKFFTSVNTFLVTKQDNFLVSALDLPHLLKNGFSLLSSMFSVDLMKSTFKLMAHAKDFFFSFNFYGIGCYRLGDYIMKLSLEPENISPKIGRGEPQKETVNWFLASHESSFNLMIEMCENLEAQPINNLKKEWKKAPKFCLGKIKIPKAAFLNSDDLAIENLSFDPFKNPEILQPVGKIQQIRKKVYEASIRTRNALNQKKNAGITANI